MRREGNGCREPALCFSVVPSAAKGVLVLEQKDGSYDVALVGVMGRVIFIEADILRPWVMAWLKMWMG